MNNHNKAYNAYYQANAGINIKKNQKIVLECKDPEVCFYFAKDIPGANIKAHEKILLELKHPKHSYFFARNIAGANIEEHFKVIFNSGNKFWLDRFIERVNYKNTKVEEWLLYI